MKSKINIRRFSLLIFITFALFSSSVVNAEESVKIPKVIEVRGQCELFETLTVKVENLQEFLKQADNRLTDIILCNYS